MADPEVARSASRAAGAASTARLLDHVAGLLVEHVVGSRGAREAWRLGPLVILSPADDAATAAITRALGTSAASAAPGLATTWSGAALDREIAMALDDDRLDRLAAAFAAARLVVVDRIDRIVSAERQQALVHLFDAATAAGAVWAVSTAAHPAQAFVPQCGSRLCGGVVVAAADPVAWQRPAGPVPSLGRIIRAAARLHDLAPATVVGPSRGRTVAAARGLAMYLARRLTGRSFQAIGLACGGRDHTTVLHGVRVCGERIARDPAFAADVERLATGLAGRPAGTGRSRVGSAVAARAAPKRHRQRRRPAPAATRSHRQI